MSKIIVCKLVRLGKDGDKYDKKLHAKEIRPNVKVDEAYVKEFNKLWEKRGQLYVEDKEATKKRNEAIAEKAKKSTSEPLT